MQWRKNVGEVDELEYKLGLLTDGEILTVHLDEYTMLTGPVNVEGEAVSVGHDNVYFLRESDGTMDDYFIGFETEDELPMDRLLWQLNKADALIDKRGCVYLRATESMTGEVIWIDRLNNDYYTAELYESGAVPLVIAGKQVER